MVFESGRETGTNHWNLITALPGRLLTDLELHYTLMLHVSIADLHSHEALAQSSRLLTTDDFL